MSGTWLGIAIFFAAWAAGRISLPAIRRRYLERGWVDAPGGRKIQPEAVPYGGGAAVLFGFGFPVLGGLVAGWLQSVGWLHGGRLLAVHGTGLASKAVEAGVILAGAAVMMVLGRIDDRRGLSAGLRFAVQVGAAALVAVAGPRITVFLAAPWLHVVITVLWIVFVTNCFNFIDNMDGLLAGTGIAVAAALFAIAAADGQLFVAAFALALAGALTGVLAYNRPPARIYLGDEGSLLVGFLLASLTVLVSYQSESRDDGVTWLPLVIPFLVLAVPVADGVLTLGGRLSRGVAPWTAGRDHLSHRLARRGWGEPGAVLLLVAVNFGCGAAALLLYGMAAPHGWAAAALALMMVACLLRAWQRRAE